MLSKKEIRKNSGFLSSAENLNGSRLAASASKALGCAGPSLFSGLKGVIDLLAGGPVLPVSE